MAGWSKYNATIGDESWLRARYIDQRMTRDQIADEAGCHRNSVHKALRRLGIPLRGHDGIPVRGSSAPRPKKAKDTLHNESWLRQKYVEENMAGTEIADVCGVKFPSVYSALRKFGIPVRDASDAKAGRPNSTVWTDEMRESLRQKNSGVNAPNYGKRGPLHGNWQGGKTKQGARLRGQAEAHEFRMAVLRKAGHACEWPGCGVAGMGLHVHHVRPFAKHPAVRYDADNGLALCRFHHYVAEFPHLAGTEIVGFGSRYVPVKAYHDADWLRDEYQAGRRSMSDIARQCGCRARTIAVWLDTHGIPRRPFDIRKSNLPNLKKTV